MRPFALVRGALADARSLSAVVDAVDADPAWLRKGEAPKRFVPQASSLRAAEVIGLDLQALARAVLDGPAGDDCRRLVGPRPALNLDRCWVRRQYAPHRYPPLHSPHTWHQDGALGYAFLDDARPHDHGGLLTLATCWIALDPCGEHAPGLELVEDTIDRVLAMAELADADVRSRHAPETLRRPRLEAGDALVFGGGVLHHTHVVPSMTLDRTSLELRFFPADRLPARLPGDRFLTM